MNQKESIFLFLLAYLWEYFGNFCCIFACIFCPFYRHKTYSSNYDTYNFSTILSSRLTTCVRVQCIGGCRVSTLLWVKTRTVEVTDVMCIPPTRQNHIKVPTYYTTLLLYAQTQEIETCNNNYVDILLKLFWEDVHFKRTSNQSGLYEKRWQRKRNPFGFSILFGPRSMRRLC